LVSATLTRLELNEQSI